MPRPGLPLFLSHTLRILALILIAFLATAPAGARSPNLSKYPLRVHVLVAGDGQRQNRMSASGSVSCDAIDDMLSSSSDSSDGSTSGIGISGIFGDPCSFQYWADGGPLAVCPERAVLLGRGTRRPGVSTQRDAGHQLPISRLLPGASAARFPVAAGAMEEAWAGAGVS